MADGDEVRNPVVRKALAAFDDDAEGFRETLHPDVEWYPIETDRRPDIGIEAAVRNRQEWLDTWGEHRLEIEEVIEAGDSVVALIHLTGRGSFSGAAADVRFYAQFKVRDGKIVYIYDHEERAAALEAAGLSE
jgi:ketosteroid isomerase-like protein